MSEHSINEIWLGVGRHIVNHGCYGDKAAVFIEAAPSPGAVGTDAGGILPSNKVSNGATVIMFENLAGIDALLSELQEARKHIGERRGLKPKVAVQRKP